jgi:hypothetical protein
LSLPLALTLALTLPLARLTLALLARVREVPARVLQSGRRPGEVAIDVHVAIRALECVTEPIESFPRGIVLTLGDALGGITERRPRRPACLACSRLQLREFGCQCPSLLRGHLVQRFAEALQVFCGLLGITVLVRVLLAGRGARQRAAQRTER